MTENKGPVINIDVNSLNHDLVTDPGRSTGGIDRRSQIVANSGPLIRENRLSGNDLNGMVVRGGTLTTEGVWDDTDIVHVVLNQTIYVPDFHTYGGLRMESSATQSLVVKLEGDNAGFTATGPPAGYHRPHRRGAVGVGATGPAGGADVAERLHRGGRLHARRRPAGGDEAGRVRCA